MSMAERTAIIDP